MTEAKYDRKRILLADVEVNEDYSAGHTFAAEAVASGFDGIRYLVRHDPARKLYGYAVFGRLGREAAAFAPSGLAVDDSIPDTLVDRGTTSIRLPGATDSITITSEGAPMSRVRVHNFSISLDGFGTGEGLSLEAPFGHAGHRLHGWMFATRFWDAAGAAGVDNAFAERHERGIGAEIMGAGKFGPPGWQDDPEWRGWWGPNPPFHTPTYVLTHRPRPPLEMEGGTTFHFLDVAPVDALAAARQAADGQDVRIGGGPTMLREFVAAGLVDHLHLVQVPILLGRGVRLWDGLEALDEQYEVEAVSTPSGVTHLTFTR